MALSDYMMQGSNGTVNIKIDNLPSKGFINATKVLDIAKARILSGEERNSIKPGSPDVLLISATGERKYITRKDLVNNYKHSSGKKITIAFLKNNRNYVVMRPCNESYRIMKLPDNCVGSFKGKTVKNGSYIVFRNDVQGNMNIETLGIVSPSNFKKMFKIPMQDVIKRHIDGKGNKNFTLFTNKPNRNVLPKSNVQVANDFGNNNNSLISDSNNNVINRPLIQNSTPGKFSGKFNTKLNRPNIDTSKLGINPSSINIPTKAELTKYKYKVVNQIMSMNNTSQLIGYTIMELNTGKLAQLEVHKVAKLCEEKLVENAKLVQLENGTRYLQGNGIVLKNLPKILA